MTGAKVSVQVMYQDVLRIGMRGKHARSVGTDRAGVKAGVDLNPLDIREILIAGSGHQSLNSLVGAGSHGRDSVVGVCGNDEVDLAVPLFLDGFGSEVSKELSKAVVRGAVADTRPRPGS